MYSVFSVSDRAVSPPFASPGPEPPMQAARAIERAAIAARAAFLCAVLLTTVMSIFSTRSACCGRCTAGRASAEVARVAVIGARSTGQRRGLVPATGLLGAVERGVEGAPVDETTARGGIRRTRQVAAQQDAFAGALDLRVRHRYRREQ